VPVAIVASILIGAVVMRLRRLVILWLVPFIFGYAILNVIFGPDWGVALIYHFGNQASATVTGTFQTNDVYNDQNVVGYHVLIRPANGSVVEGSFRSDDFNVYAFGNSRIAVKWVHGCGALPSSSHCNKARIALRSGSRGLY
jgi:hypothetical protein